MSSEASRWMRVAGWRMHARMWDEAGAAHVPVVLVHGLSMSSRYLVPLADELAPHFRVYAPDLPGFGKSDDPRRVLDVDALADVLAAWLDAAGLGRALFVGNSLGCQLLGALAERRPEGIAAAVFVGPTADPAGRWVPRLIARAAVDVWREHPTLWPIIAHDYLRTGVRRTWRTLKHLTADRPEDRLQHLTAPTLVVRGDRDVIVPAAWAEEVAQRLPDGRLLTLPGAAHAAHFGQPGAVASAVRALAAEVTL